MTIHSKLSPSARHRWGKCPGSVREGEKYPERPSGAAAIDGTHSHTLLEACLTTNNTAAHFIGTLMNDGDGVFEVDAERAERVQFALDYIRRGDLLIISEQRVNPEPMIGIADLDGTVDVQIIAHTGIEIIDYKDGMSPVDAKDNPQLEQYGFGVLAERGTVFTTVTLTIIQPKLRLKGMSGISSHTYSISDFIGKRDQLIAEATAALAPDAPLVPGDIQCKYCRASGKCAAQVNHAMTASGITFENLDVAKQAADKEPNTMSDDQIREILEAAPLIRQMLEGVEAEVLRRFESGHPVDGLKAVRGRGSRAWAFDAVKTAEVLKKMGLPKDTIWSTSVITPAQAEKVRWKKRDGTEKQLSERQLATLRGEYIKKSDGKITIVSDSDSRPAITMSVTGMFAPTLPSWLS